MNRRTMFTGDGMDAVLALIVAMLVFVGLMIIINRSAKLIAFIGIAIVIILILRATGILG